MKEPQFHIITYHIKGLNIGKEPFVWNNKLLIKDAGIEIPFPQRVVWKGE